MSDDAHSPDSDSVTGDGLEHEEDDLIVESTGLVADKTARELSELKRLVQRPINRADVADALWISLFEITGPNGEFPIEPDRLWQIFDRLFRGEAVSISASVLEPQVFALFATARHESFEDGIESSFSMELTRLILKHGNDAVNAIGNILFDESTSSDVAAQALRSLGKMTNPNTTDARRALIERALTADSHIIRDGAVLGLATTDDIRSETALENACSREPYKFLRSQMQHLLDHWKGV